MREFTLDETFTQMYKELTSESCTRKWLIARLNDNHSSVIVVECPEKEPEEENFEKDYEGFMERFEVEARNGAHKCAYGFVKALSHSGVLKLGVILYSSDDHASSKDKMIYPEALSQLKALSGIQFCTTLYELDELTTAGVRPH